MSSAAAVREFVESRIAAGAMPGAVWRVEDRLGVLASGAAGLAVVEPVAEPVAESTPYDLASLTKPLATALLAVRMEQSGAVALDDPLSRHLEEVAGAPWQGVRLSDLARHQAGLPPWRALYLRAAGRDGFLAAILSERPAPDPGTARYSDLGYLLLGFVLERRGGATLDRLFDEGIAATLGLRGEIGFSGTVRFEHAAAVERDNGYERAMVGSEGEGYAWRTAIRRGEVHDGNAHALGGTAGHAGLFGTARGVAAVAQAILHPSALGLQATARRLLLDPGRAGRSVGFEAAAASGAARGVLPDDAPGHTGFTGTSLWLEPGRGRAYVLLTNRVHPEVPAEDFQPVRREFHRLAAAIPDRR